MWDFKARLYVTSVRQLHAPRMEAGAAPDMNTTVGADLGGAQGVRRPPLQTPNYVAQNFLNDTNPKARRRQKSRSGSIPYKNPGSAPATRKQHS